MRLSVKGVARTFGARAAVRPLSFTVGEGEVLGVVGRNGAGKTTLMRIIAGVIAPDAGAVVIDGVDCRAGRGDRVAVGYLPDGTPLPGELRVDEYLRFRGRLRGLRRAQLASAVEAALRAVALSGERSRLIGALSRGMKQRVALAEIMLEPAGLWVLDEPTAGLDPLQVQAFHRIVKARPEGVAVLISSHDLGALGAVADRLLVMSEGELLVMGTLEELRLQAGTDEAGGLDAVFAALAGGADRP